MEINMVDKAEGKYCRDCHWSRDKYSYENKWICVSPKNFRINKTTNLPVISLVTGTPELVISKCWNVRAITEMCGPLGNWFQTTKELFPIKTDNWLPTISKEKSLKKIGLEDL
jgi:hypothetical protein